MKDPLQSQKIGTNVVYDTEIGNPSYVVDKVRSSPNVEEGKHSVPHTDFPHEIT